MPRCGTHGVVGDSRGSGPADPRRVRKEGIEPAVTSLLEEKLARERLASALHQGNALHRQGRYKCHRNEQEQSSEWRLPVGWVACNCQRYSGTMDTRLQSALVTWRRSIAMLAISIFYPFRIHLSLGRPTLYS